MAITQIGIASGTATASAVSTSSAITVAVNDIVVFCTSINQQDTTNRFTAHVLDGTSTATVGTITNIFNGIGASAGEVSLTASWARVTGAGTLTGRATLAVTRTVALAVMVLRGASTGGSPFTAGASSSGNTSNPASGNVTPGAAGDWFIGFGAYRQESGGIVVTRTATPSNWSQQVTASSGTGVTNAWAGIETWEATNTTAYQSAPTIDKTVFWAQAATALTAAAVAGGPDRQLQQRAAAQRNAARQMRRAAQLAQLLQTQALPVARLNGLFGSAPTGGLTGTPNQSHSTASRLRRVKRRRN